MKEQRIFGPPGTGKTTALATDYVPEAVARFGRDKVMVVSFTKTAAKEIATKPAIKDTKYATKGRPVDINRDLIGTLHKICYHGLEQPTIIETDNKLIGEWNDLHGDKYKITGQNISSVDNVYAEQANSKYSPPADGDIILGYLNVKRNKLTPEKFWHPDLIFFRDKWEEFKKETDSMDFTDIIEQSITELPYAPGQPDVLFVDEAQDFTSLQLKLCRSWAQQMEYLLLVGDDDQTIYRFAGASPEAFLKPEVPKNMKTILSQSYRVPQEILDKSSTLIHRIKNREPKDFNARRESYPSGKFVMGRTIDGKNIKYKEPEDMLPHIERNLQQNKSIMILTSCSYMLDPIKKILREEALPFANRYRRSRADWNPLYSSGHGISATDLLLSFHSHGMDGKYWDVLQFLNWAKYLKVGDDGLKKKVGKKYIKRLKLAVENNEDGLDSIRNTIPKILNPNAIHQALNHNISWLEDNLLKHREKGLKYPLKILKQHGLPALEKEPQITIGTIHSVKGAEADCVILFPDISGKADAEVQIDSEEAIDSMYRLFYVGMTRAREELILCDASLETKGIQKMCVLWTAESD